MQLSNISNSAKNNPPGLRRLQLPELELLAEERLKWFERETLTDPFETGRLDTDLFLENTCEAAGYSLDYVDAPSWREKGHLIYAKTEPFLKRVSVALCKDIDERSRRHAMAHEAFHVFHDHDFFMAYKEVPGAINPAQTVLDYNANDFARIIHLPRALFEEKVRETKSKRRSILSAIDNYSTMFGISTMSVKIRLKELNLASPEALGL